MAIVPLLGSLTLKLTLKRGTDTIFSKKYISFLNSFMLTPIDLVMVSKESSFKELSNSMHFNQVQHIPGMVDVS